jgi:ketosteroid isomerase-like protein
MSQENVEIVQEVVDAYLAGLERGDFGAAWDTGKLADDCEWVADPSFVEQRSFRGREEFAQFMRRWTEGFEEYSNRFERLIEAGNNKVLGLFVQSGTGKGSGIRFDQPYAVLYDLQDGQVVRIQAYNDRNEALEAAGLRE